MAHSFKCPYCNFTTRITDELFTRKVAGRRVKVPCKGCREPLIVDAVTSELRVTPFQSKGAKAAEPHREGFPNGFEAPSTRARPLIEEELPTLRRNDIPSDEAFLSPAQGSEPPSTSWLKSLPPAKVADPATFFAAPARSKVRRGAMVAFVGAGCVFVAGIWFPWSPQSAAVSADQVVGTGPSPAVMAAQGESREQDAPDESGAETRKTVECAPGPSEKALEPPRGAEHDKSRDVSPKAFRPPPPQEEPAVSEPETPSLGELPLPGPFDRGAAAAALAAAEGQLAGCRTASDPSGVARVTVTFAPSGRVTTATLAGPPFAGSPTGGCIASRFRSARVPPFEGSYVTVTKTVVVQ